MPNIVVCPGCEAAETTGGPRNQAEITLNQQGGGGIELRGILRCLYEHCRHEWPVTLVANRIREIGLALPSHESNKLNDNIPEGIRHDIEEAERAHFAQCYKASVVMCRRAIQLALERITNETRLTLGPLLAQVRTPGPSPFTSQTDALVDRIKDYGDTGAHQPGVLDPMAVAVIIFDTVQALNELAPRLASQSGTGSNEP